MRPARRSIEPGADSIEHSEQVKLEASSVEWPMLQNGSADSCVSACSGSFAVMGALNRSG
jgi:hypothetical protein